MMPIYRRRRLSKRTRSRSSFRVPFDPRVLRRPATGNNANAIRPLIQSALLSRIREARSIQSDMEKKLEEVSRTLEIYSNLNDAFQIVQRDQTQKIEHLESEVERLSGGGQLTAADILARGAATHPLQATESRPTTEVVQEPCPTIKLEEIDSNGESGAAAVPEEEEDGEQSQLETEIIYDFVV